MNKQGRHFAIRQIISRQPVANQDELRRLLESEGYETTQTTLSRDLKEMGVGRMNSAHGGRYVLPTAADEKHLTTLFSYEVVSIEANESMIVIKTLPGRAAGVADIIDTFGLSEILGTVAGDDTIFIAPKSIRGISKLVADLRRIGTAH